MARRGFGGRALEQLREMWNWYQRELIRQRTSKRLWHPSPGAIIQKGKTAEAITVGSIGDVTLWKGIDPDEEATTVIVPCKNYYHDIDAGKWVHFIRLTSDYGELIAGEIC